MTNNIGITGGDIGTVGAANPNEKINYAYLKEGKTSVQTSDYFAVGSTIEVMGTTWDNNLVSSLLKDVDVGLLSNNKYRTFKVTGHVTNEFNREFAKLDSFPADDTIGPATTNANKPDYLLKITSNNGTTHSYPTLAARINVNEVQIITLGDGQKEDNSGQVWKLYYKGEESQNMDASSTLAQVAEEINGFSQLSGPVTVTADGTTGLGTGHPRYRVTFDAKDGDVAEMTAVADSGSVAVVTRAHGWSIEGPVGLGMDTMQAGGIVNITAKEVCTFEATASVTAGQFCYNNICGPKSAGATAANMETAVQGVKDDNGVAVLGTASVTKDSHDIIVTMPLAEGMSCDGLEMRNTNTAVTKSVDKNNNGKSFKITRSFLTSTAIASVTDATNVACAAGKCHEAVQAVDSIIMGGASCDTKAASDVSYPLHRDAGTVTISGDGTATSIALPHLVQVSVVLRVKLCTWDVMLSHLIQCPQQVPLPYQKQCYTILQLEAAVLPKRPKVHTKVLNVLTVGHVMEVVVYLAVTQATQANRAKHKQCWFNLPQVLDSTQEMHSYLGGELVIVVCLSIY